VRRTQGGIRRRSFSCLIAVALSIASRHGFAASEHDGQVTFGGLPLPGATVTASQGDKQSVTSTDPQGLYKLADLTDGVWTIRVEMLGFSTLTQEITISADSPASAWELKLRPFAEISRDIPPRPVENQTTASLPPPGGRSPAGPTRPAAPGTGDPPPSPNTQRGFQRAGVNASDAAAAKQPAPSADPVNGDPGMGAADGLLVNGSVNNGAASPFAQMAAFGNNRRGVRSLYTGGVAAILGNSAWDAAPFSFTNQSTPKPAYNDLQLAANFGGPLRIPGLIRNGPNLFVGFQRTSDHTAITQPALVPTLLERGGDFSQTRDALGRPVPIVDPTTGVAFPGGVIPGDRISPQAAALLGYYPKPNVDGRYNYQTPLVTVTRQDSFQSRVTQRPFGRNQMYGNVTYQRTTTDTTYVFGFTDSTEVSGVDAAVNWSRRFSQFFSLRLRYQFTRLSTQVTPYFANRTNVSGDAGITGNNQDPVNWGPPNLAFASGVEPLTSAQSASNLNQTHAWSAESLLTRGRHNITFGGGVHRQQFDVLSQQNARGAFAFTGATTGSDLADFMLGVPHTSSIAFGNADKYLRGFAYEAYVTDDWRLSPGLTLNPGVRWEYEAPLTELFGRLVNLDVAPGFAAVSPVVADDPVGALTGIRYPASLVRPDRGGVQPRMGVAWRPVPGSSLVVRGGYGVYRNNNVYQSIALLMAQQPPLSKSFSVQNSAANPLTLANGFIAAPGITPNTFAVDPGFRVGYAENWQASVQRDLPASLTVLATYLGTRGSRLMQEFFPNTYPSGATNPCPTCPAGFVYLTSNGRSTRHAGQLEVRRRLRNGLTATTRYTLSKASDDAGAFTGVSLTGPAVAQDWLNLEGEWGPSNFDQRHLLSAQVQYTSGVGVSGGTLVDGIKGTFLKGWTVTSQLTAGSGLPLTPVYLTSVPGTPTIRPDAMSSAGATPDGVYANPSGFAAPAPGHWGTAGRNSITGPAQFGLNAGLTRTFPWGDRLNLDWRIDATNVLNRVTYSGVTTLFGSPQFGLPNGTNAMRKVQTTLRLRF
jgi:hypothetical protein